ncbi:MAG: arginyl-tRNA--protein arginylyltransferase [Cytophagales bacterium]|nr:MAG: arginyl-tRNA--protein arginylyltransferase [Cytophagales bacterium]
MFGNIEIPDAISPQELDLYLEAGWFRMGQTIFTCNFLHFDNTFYSAIWLRHNLENYSEDESFEKLKKQNKKFSIVIRPAIIDKEKEQLYELYKTNIKFETANSLQDLLLGQSTNSIYSTQEISIYHKNLLIAVGYFDIGDSSAMGIVSFYHPDYKKYSLGKFIIMNKIAYCKKLELKYFYPGYFAPSYSAFDYKLKIASTDLEFLNFCTNEWMGIRFFSKEHILINIMEKQLATAKDYLADNGYKILYRKYEFYNANHTPQFKGYQLFDFPIFLIIVSADEQGFAPILVYDVSDKCYKIFKCIGYPCSVTIPASAEYYRASLLKVREEMIASPHLEIILAQLQKLSKV